MYSQYKIRIYSSIQGTNAARFICKRHYLGKIALGCKYTVVLSVNGIIKGVAQYGEPVGTKVKAKYNVDLELKRFVLSPSCPKNTGSWFMAKAYKLLPKRSVVISYADPSQGHEGVLYKACNYKYIGKQQYATPYLVGKGFKIATRCMYQTIGDKPTATSVRLKRLHKAGKAKIVYAEPKHIFIYGG